MSESTISRNSFPGFGKPPVDYSKMTREEFEKAAGMKFMSYDEMINGNKPDSETGRVSGGADASGSVAGVGFSAGAGASIKF